MTESDRSCFLCAGPADGAAEHVPPEVLYKGAHSVYKIPAVLTVPSCVRHNEATSADDEAVAWIMSSACALFSQAALDVQQGLLRPVQDRIQRDRPFSDARLALIGARVLRDPGDYDDAGNPKLVEYDDEYVRSAEVTIRKTWSVLKRGLQKIAAGVYYHTSGIALGEHRTAGLAVVCPDLKQVEPEISLTALAVSETDFFARLPAKVYSARWIAVASGSPEVFQCRLARRRNSWRFKMSMLFYTRVRVWIVS